MAEFIAPRVQGRRADTLDVALRTAESFQASIRHADAKVAALLSVEGGLAAAVVARSPRTLSGQPGWLTAAMVTAFVVYLVGAAIAGWHLATAVRPRLTPPARSNRFSFPAVATGSVRWDRADGMAEASALVATLAGIALAKYGRVARAVPWLATCAAGAFGWLFLTGWTG
ncbi:hypothetical protein [Actinocatenispora rupis]|nr:hypothetical protein [Actinocatenispora rupis]